MPKRDRAAALLSLSLLQLFVIVAGLSVVNLTPNRRLAPQPPTIAARNLVTSSATPVPGVDPDAAMPAAGTLGTRLNSLIGGPSAKINAVVVDTATGEVLYDQGAERPATPASTTKLVTSVAALAALGPERRLTTKVVQGTPGRIVLVGGGDPTLTARPVAGAYPAYASLPELARQTAAALKAAGTNAVRVDYDTSIFQGSRTAAGWKPNYLPDGEVAPITGLTVDEGRISQGARARVSDPPASAATTFARLLTRYGVTARIGGRATASPQAAQLGAVQSPPVSVLVEHLLTTSDNDLAEAMARQVAIERRLPATFAGGAQAVRDVLAELGVTEGIATGDGSGLNPLNRITPLALAKVVALAAETQQPDLRSAITGMPIAGFSGTLADRYVTVSSQAALGLVRAKTGTLSGVSTLAGLTYDADGRLLAFAFMAGDGKTPVDPGKIDLLTAALTACGCS